MTGRSWRRSGINHTPMRLISMHRGTVIAGLPRGGCNFLMIRAISGHSILSADVWSTIECRGAASRWRLNIAPSDWLPPSLFFLFFFFSFRQTSRLRKSERKALLDIVLTFLFVPSRRPVNKSGNLYARTAIAAWIETLTFIVSEVHQLRRNANVFLTVLLCAGKTRSARSNCSWTIPRCCTRRTSTRAGRPSSSFTDSAIPETRTGYMI